MIDFLNQSATLPEDFAISGADFSTRVLKLSMCPEARRRLSSGLLYTFLQFIDLLSPAISDMSSAIMSSEDRVWLITGCSSGFGRELVSAAASRGDRVIATARKIEDLDYCQSISNLQALQLDVTSSQAELDAKIREAIAMFGRIDVLVNNAGYVLSGVWEELRYE